MMRTLVSRTLYEKRWFLAGWSLVFAVMSTLVMMFFPSFSNSGGFEQIAKSMPKELQGFIGDPSIFGTIDGFISSQIYDVRMSLLVIIMTLVLATGLTIREEESGDLRTTLATSLSRHRVVIEKYIAAIIILLLLNMVTTAGIYVGLISLNESTSHSLLWQLYALSCLFSLTMFTIVYCIALATGNRAITMFVGLFVAIGSYLLSTFARSVDWLEGWEKLSIIHYFDTAGLRTGTFSMTNVVVLVCITGLFLAIALLSFRRRDIM